MRAVLTALILTGALVAPVEARLADTECWITNGHLYVIGLPTTYGFAITYDPYPVGTTQMDDDGLFDRQWPYPTAYVWVRGHGPSLIKAGKQLNDYHVIAMCQV